MYFLNEEQRRIIITKFISVHQGCKAEEVVDGVRDHISRVPAFNTLRALIMDGIVKDKATNRRDHSLYVDEGNLLVSVPKELEEFGKAYITLLQKSKKKINEKDFSEIASYLGIQESDPSRWLESDANNYIDFELKNAYESIARANTIKKRMANLTKRNKNLLERINRDTHNKLLTPASLVKQMISDTRESLSELNASIDDIIKYEVIFLTDTPIFIFYYLIDIILYRSTMIWPTTINNKKALATLYSITYTKVAEFQLELTNFLTSAKIYRIQKPINHIAIMRESLKNALPTYLHFYKALNMKSEIEAITNSILEVSREIQDHSLSTYNMLYLKDEVSEDYEKAIIALERIERVARLLEIKEKDNLSPGN